MSVPYKIGVIHGRFQILHNDHMKYLMAGRERCTHLVVGITNPDPRLTGHDSTNPSRSLESANPLTYYERYSLLVEALLRRGLAYQDFSVVPFPISAPELIMHYVPMEAVFFLTIYDDWGRRKLEVLSSLGVRTEIMWERPVEQKGISASDVRRRMVEDKEWESMVPAGTAKLLKMWKVPERIRKLVQGMEYQGLEQKFQDRTEKTIPS
jgi:nicotinamide-nucleotide adenylyltransferase